jgi:hypothetical protein
VLKTTEINVQEIAKSLLPKVREMIDAEMAKLGASAELGQKVKGAAPTEEGIATSYYETSNVVFRAVVAAAAQRMMADGANRNTVSRRLNSTPGRSSSPPIPRLPQRWRQRRRTKRRSTLPIWPPILTTTRKTLTREMSQRSRTRSNGSGGPSSNSKGLEVSPVEKEIP